jgi:hypothetical protein
MKAFNADVLLILRKLAEQYKDGPLPQHTIHLVLANVKNPNNRDGVWRWPSTNSLDTGWWLNGAHNVSAEIDFQVKEIEGTIHLANVRMTWTWDDEVDARNVHEWWRAKETWEDVWKGTPNLIIESIIWDMFVDGVLDADFKIKIETPWIELEDLSTHIQRR